MKLLRAEESVLSFMKKSDFFNRENNPCLQEILEYKLNKSLENFFFDTPLKLEESKWLSSLLIAEVCK